MPGSMVQTGTSPFEKPEQCALELREDGDHSYVLGSIMMRLLFRLRVRMPEDIDLAAT